MNAIIQQLRQQCSKSMIPGIPQMAEEKHFLRLILKTAIFVCCVIGFVIQTKSFLDIYWSYPTILNVDIDISSKVEAPAFTICNENGFQRSLFCKKYPLKCVPCKHSQHRNNKSTCPSWIPINETFPKLEEIDQMELNASLKELDQLSHSPESLIFQCSYYTPRGWKSCRNESYYTYVIHHDRSSRSRKCVVINSRMNKVNNYAVHWSYPQGRAGIFRLGFEYAPKEYSRRVHPKIHIAAHIPNVNINPFIYGTEIPPTLMMSFIMKVSLYNFLPPPYSTNCINYRGTAAKSDATAERFCSREDCMQNCIKEFQFRKCGCYALHLPLDYTKKVCPGSYKCLENIENEECSARCPIECRYIEYEFHETKTFQAEKVSDFAADALNENSLASSYYIDVYSPQVTIYNYTPKFEKIELFSYIGGLISIWLGISLIAVFDFLGLTASLLISVVRSKKRQQTGDYLTDSFKNNLISHSDCKKRNLSIVQCD